MRAQRPAHLAPALNATAQDLPFDDGAFDAALAGLTVHQWPDLAKGLAEVRRVTRGPVVVLTFDPDALDGFWLADYCPEVIATEQRRYPPVETIRSLLGSAGRVEAVPLPIDCTDGFAEAFYARPESFLDPRVRAAQSAWGFVEPWDRDRAVENLRRDLESGAWDERYGQLRTRPEFTGSLRLVIGEP